ncbi:ATP-binding protein [Azotosporobacter soli]|uniref:ATP-binding protein n=1 Tax=Azotosporobacter soli TaxID=3055040 RepID=UPI0031FE5544
MLLNERSVRTTLIAWVLLASALFFMAGALYTYKVVREQVYQEFTLQSKEAINHIHARIKEGITEPAFADVRQMAFDYRTYQLMQGIGSDAISEKSTLAPLLYQPLDAFVRAHKHTLGVGVGTQEGGYFEYPRFFAERGYDPRGRFWYKEALQQPGQPYITNPYVRATGELTVAVAQAVEQEGRIAGVVVFGWNIQELAKEVEKMKIGSSGYITVLSRDDRIVIYPQHTDWLMLTPQEIGVTDLANLNEDSKEFKLVRVEDKWELMWGVVDEKTGWKVIALLEAVEIEAQVMRLLWPILALYCLTLLSALALIFVLVERQVIAPIHQLKQGALKIAAGMLTARVNISARNEFGMLAATFNEMAGQLQNNFTAIKEANQELFKREREFKTLVENAQDIILRLDKEWKVVYVNPAIEPYASLTAPELAGRQLDARDVPEPFWQAVNEILVEEECGPKTKRHPLEFEMMLRDGAVVYFQADIIPEYADDGQIETVLSIIRNVTQQKIMEKQLLRLDRLNTIGEMAAGIAHEVRNPMTTVRGFLQMMSQKEADAKNVSFYELMIEELDRANGIISEFLSLAKNRPVSLERRNINDIIRAITPLLQADAAVADKSIELQLGEVSEMLLDEKEIRQLVINMARNGLEAMQSKGILKIKTYREKDEIVLAIRDEGEGISQEILDNIGIPFYTTKANGTGLGLAVCYSIAARHRAKINVETGKEGTVFQIRFCLDD